MDRLSLPRRLGAFLPFALVAAAACGGDGGSDPVVPSQLQKTAGDQVSGTVGQSAAAPTLKVTDAKGRAARGIVVNFAVTGGGTLGATTDTTDAQGVATAGSWTLGTVAGTQTVVATSPKVAGVTATFTATAAAGAPAKLAFVTQPVPAPQVNTPFPGGTVEIQDSFGNRTASTATVTLGLGGTGGLGTLSGATTAVAVDGRATFGDVSSSFAGPQSLSASSPGLATGLSSTYSLASGPATAIVRVAGLSQLGIAGSQAFVRPTVRVTDAGGNGISGATVTFSVTGGGGSASGTTVTTDANGLAAVGAWTLGATPGSNGLQASSGGITADFTADGLARRPYEIELKYINTPTPRQQQAFESAWQRWRNIITTDVQDAAFQSGAQPCVAGQPMPSVIDDMVIWVDLTAIDGPNQVLGSAGPCYYRTGGTNPNIPIAGVMRFDTADLPSLEASGQLDLVIIHEMGHVLGIGTMWSISGLAQFGGTDSTSFNGAAAKNFWTSTLSGPAGTRVPLENCLNLSSSATANCGQGTRDGHWKESTFGSELMTGYFNGGQANPLSALTINALADMGYQVDLTKADPYTRPGTLMAGNVSGAVLSVGSSRKLVEGAPTWPLIGVDRTGRTTKVDRLAGGAIPR